MSVNVTFPQLLHLQDFALLGLRLVVAIVFGASGYLHLKDPIGRAKSIELSPAPLGRARCRGSPGEPRPGHWNSHPAGGAGAHPGQSGSNPKEGADVEDRVLGREGRRLALRPHAHGHEPGHSLHGRRQSRLTVLSLASAGTENENMRPLLRGEIHPPGFSCSPPPVARSASDGRPLGRCRKLPAGGRAPPFSRSHAVGSRADADTVSLERARQTAQAARARSTACASCARAACTIGRSFRAGCGRC